MAQGQARAATSMKEEAAQHVMLTGPDIETDNYIRHSLTGHSPIQQHPSVPQAD